MGIKSELLYVIPSETHCAHAARLGRSAHDLHTRLCAQIDDLRATLRQLRADAETADHSDPNVAVYGSLLEALA